MVVIVDGNQVTQLQVTRSGGSLASNSLHSTTITEDHVCVVVDEVKSRLVENGCGMRLRNSKTDGIGETLTKRASCDFDARGVVSFGVAGSDAVDLL